MVFYENLWNCIVGYLDNDTTPIEVKVRNDEITLAKICLTLDGLAITHVRSSKSAKEAWNALANSYEDKSMGRRLALERKLYRYILNSLQYKIFFFSNIYVLIEKVFMM